MTGLNLYWNRKLTWSNQRSHRWQTPVFYAIRAGVAVFNWYLFKQCIAIGFNRQLANLLSTLACAPIGYVFIMLVLDNKTRTRIMQYLRHDHS